MPPKRQAIRRKQPLTQEPSSPPRKSASPPPKKRAAKEKAAKALASQDDQEEEETVSPFESADSVDDSEGMQKDAVDSLDLDVYNYLCAFLEGGNGVTDDSQETDEVQQTVSPCAD